MTRLWQREPALILATVQALIALVTAFGLRLTVDQIGAVLAVTAAVLGLVTRSQVTPAAKDPPNPPGGSSFTGSVFIGSSKILFVFLLSGCGLLGSATEPEPCSFENPAYSARVLECDERIGQCPKRDDKTPREDCPALIECEKWLAEVCE